MRRVKNNKKNLQQGVQKRSLKNHIYIGIIFREFQSCTSAATVHMDCGCYDAGQHDEEMSRHTKIYR